jgi:hypothetical protein
MKLDDRVQSIRASRPSNRDFATYGLPRGYTASIWASEGPARIPVYLWVELDYEDPPQVWCRVFSTRARTKPPDWDLMKNDGLAESNPFDKAVTMFKARRKLTKGRYVLQAKFELGKKLIELPGITFRVL